MHSSLKKPVAVVITALLVALGTMPALAQFEPDHDPGTPEFERTWARTDMPVQQGEVERTWMWGPNAFTEVMTEEYADSPGGERQVQYFDKSRMEDNTDGAEPPWDVTNGLLATELITGRLQLGDDQFEEREPATVNVVGDQDVVGVGGMSPSYEVVGENLDQEPHGEGDLINTYYDWSHVGPGNAGEDVWFISEIEPGSDDPYFGEILTYDVRAAHHVEETNHTVAAPFWEFMNSDGLVYENGQTSEGSLFENPFFATGLPISEANWTSATVGGEERWVLFQCFERRCLTYTPGNPDGFLVEAGNIGQHYYTWRYEQEPEPEPEPEAQEYAVHFGELNESGVDGMAHLTLDGDQLTVQVNASGLTPDQEHMQHIHGDDVEVSTCPTPELDADEDGLISFEEGSPAYGGAVLPLEPYPSADADSNVSFEETYDFDAEGVDLTAHTVVLHGMDVEGEYNASLPVACGEIVAPGGQEFSAELSGDEQVPPVETDAAGEASFTVREGGFQVEFELWVSNIENVTAAHIHLAPAGENGGVVVPLFSADEPVTVGDEDLLEFGTFWANELSGDLEGMTPADLVAAMEAGHTYVNVHTEANPGGEIRGQIELVS